MGSFNTVLAANKNGKEFKAYVARPRGVAKAPGLILMHEVYGVSDSIVKLADRFAAQGFFVVAPNMYWETDPDASFVYETPKDMEHIKNGTLPLERKAVLDAHRDVARDLMFKFVRRAEQGFADLDAKGPLAVPYAMTPQKQQMLLDCTNRGLVDVYGTDHAPHTRAEMEPGWKDAWSIPFGNPQVEHYITALLTHVAAGRMSLETLVRVCAEQPARLMGVWPRKGVIQVDADADFAVLDLNARGTLTDAEVYTKVGWSPYSGMQYHGRPVMTVVRGRVVMRNGKVEGEPGYGRLVTRKALA